MKYKLTMTSDEAIIARMKAKNTYPMVLGGVTWEAGKVVTVDDLKPFLDDPRELIANPRLTDEQILEHRLLHGLLAVTVLPETKKHEESHGKDHETKI